MDNLIDVFVDTNIIIDLLADRQPHSTAAFELFKVGNKVRWTLYTSSNSIVAAYYILKKYSSTEHITSLKVLLERIRVKDLNHSDILRALSSEIGDLEDACQEICARKIGSIQYLITRDKKGFKTSTIQALSAGEFIAMYT